MKRYYIITTALFLSVFMFLPLLSLPKAENPSPPATQQVIAPAPTVDRSIRLLRKAEEKVIALPAREYVFGVVAAEMSMSCHDEALKAQAVAAWTYALYCSKDSDEQDWDVSDDPATHQAYMTRSEAMEKWGSRAEEYAARLDAVTKSVEGQVITHNSAPILAAYHDTSWGRTLAAGELWGGDYPYLISVESAGDLLSPSLQSKKILTAEEFAEICRSGGINLSGEAETWLGGTELNDCGMVKTLKICQSSISGVDARKLFSLRSAAFEVSYAPESGFTFTVRGNGHGVGLSQTGANYMALCGSTYTEILGWYYPGTTLVQQ